jgi:hypothetical protein
LHPRRRERSLLPRCRPRPHVRLRTGRPVSQYAGNEGCAGLAGAEPHA